MGHKYLIIDSVEIDKIDFNQIVISSKDTLRFSNDGSMTFIEWDGQTPSFLEDLLWMEGPFEADEMRYLLSAKEWIIDQPDEGEDNEQKP